MEVICEGSLSRSDDIPWAASKIGAAAAVFEREVKKKSEFAHSAMTGVEHCPLRRCDATAEWELNCHALLLSLRGLFC